MLIGHSDIGVFPNCLIPARLGSSTKTVGCGKVSTYDMRGPNGPLRALLFLARICLSGVMQGCKCFNVTYLVPLVKEILVWGSLEEVIMTFISFLSFSGFLLSLLLGPSWLSVYKVTTDTECIMMKY